MMKKLIRLLAFFSIFTAFNLIPSIAQAQFNNYPNDYPNNYPYCPYQTLISPPPTIAFDPGVPNGTVLWRGDLRTNFQFTRPGYECPRESLISGLNYALGLEGTTSYLGNNLYATGISGIAFRIKIVRMDNAVYGLCQVGGYFPLKCSMAYGRGLMSNQTLSIEFIKTGPITGGGVLTGKFARWYVGTSVDFVTYSWGGGVVIQPTIPTCKVSIPSITVPLRAVNVNVFTGVGKTSPSQSFNITLQCSGGASKTNTNVYTTLTDQTDPSNVSDTLRLTKDSTATGVGIQVSSGTTVIKYGPDSSAAGNKNQWNAGSTGNGTFTIPLTARYIQTAPVVKAGTANGRATFTMSYQ